MNRHDIYSKCEPGRLLHVHASTAGIPYGRFDISDKSAGLQVAIIHGEPGKSFAPHRHIEKECPPSRITEEQWSVFKGAVLISYYDLDGTFLESRWVVAGDISVTYCGGHAYELDRDADTVAVETKLGPYVNQQTDKVWL